MNELHVVISRFEDDGSTYIKLSREVDRIYLAGLLTEALAMVTDARCRVCKPEDSPHGVFLTVSRPEPEGNAAIS